MGDYDQALNIYNNLPLENAIAGAKILVNCQQDNFDLSSPNITQKKGL